MKLWHDSEGETSIIPLQPIASQIAFVVQALQLDSLKLTANKTHWE